MSDQRFTYYGLRVSAAANGTREIIPAPGAGLELWVFGLIGTTAANGVATFKDGTPTSHSGDMVLKTAASPAIFPVSANPAAPWIKCAANTAFQVTLDTNCTLEGVVVYAKVPTPAA